MRLASRLARNFLLLFWGNLLGQIFFLAGMLHLGRVIGPEGFGIWNFAQAWALYLFRANEFGLEVVSIRATARRPEGTGQYVATVTAIRLLLAILLFAAVVGALLAGLFPSQAATLVVVFSLSVFPIAFTVEWVFEGQQRIVPVSLARLLKGVLFAGLIVAFVRGPEELVWSAGFYLISVLVPAVLIFILVIRRHSLQATTWQLARSTVGEAVPVGMATLLSQFCLFAGTLYLGYVVAAHDLGQFTAAHRLVIFLWAYVVSSSHRILLPTLSQRFQDAPVMFSAFVERFFRLSALAAIPVGLLGFVTAPHVLPLLYSEEYSGSVQIFQILIWMLVAGLIRVVFEIGLIASNSQRRYLWGMAGLAGAYAILTPVSVAFWGVVGASLAAVVAEASYMVYLIVSFPFTQTRSLLLHVWRPFLALCTSAVLYVVVREMPTGLQLVAVLGSYIGTLVVLRAFEREDWRLLANLFSPTVR